MRAALFALAICGAGALQSAFSTPRCGISRPRRTRPLRAAAVDLEAQLATLVATSERDVTVEWQTARAYYDAGELLDDKNRETYFRAGLASAEAAVALEPDGGLSNKWFAILLGSLGDFLSTKEKVKNSSVIKQALDKASAELPDDATVLKALGQWAFKVASISFLERQVAKAIFGTPPTSTFKEARADALKPEAKTKAMIKLAKQKA
ncbi:hypothetical protein M885DRAFT_566954 [Pelagophyceae sp. CCMP2097]|nr:hypothetical protein M885DRAFT_566954 [Pelagophyceae sp. CCMP2097]